MLFTDHLTTFRDLRFLLVPATADIPAATLPATTTRVYPVILPAAEHRAYAYLWHTMVVGRQRATVERAALAAQADGITGADLDPGSRGKMTGQRLRDAHAAFLYALSVPILSFGNGMKLADNRGEVRDEVASLRGRAESLRVSLDGLRHGVAAFYDGREECFERCGRQADAARHMVAVLEPLLRAGSSLTSTKLGAAISQRSSYHPAGAAMRALVSAMRSAGIPVIGSTSDGYRLALNDEQLAAYIKQAKSRAESTDLRAGALDRAGALWYPETPAEIIARAGFTRQPQQPGAVPGRNTPTNPKAPARRRAARKATPMRVQQRPAAALMDPAVREGIAAYRRRLSAPAPAARTASAGTAPADSSSEPPQLSLGI